MDTIYAMHLAPRYDTMTLLGPLPSLQIGDSAPKELERSGPRGSAGPDMDSMDPPNSHLCDNVMYGIRNISRPKINHM